MFFSRHCYQKLTNYNYNYYRYVVHLLKSNGQCKDKSLLKVVIIVVH